MAFAAACRQGGYIPQSGDLIFQQSARSEVESAIQGVTSSIGGYDFTHVGIVCIDPAGEVFVLEATPPEVTLTPIEEFLHPCREREELGERCEWGEPAEHGAGDKAADPVSVAARLKPEFRHLIPKALAEGMLLIGKKYDHAYDIDDDSYYCSELIYEIFRRAADGGEVFRLNAMTFESPETGTTADGWIKYFDRLGIPIPEGEPGINPGAMSLSEAIDIIQLTVDN